MLVAAVLLAAPLSVLPTHGAEATAPAPGEGFMRLVPVAGRGEEGYSGDGGAALEARLGTWLGIEVGPDGTVYIADSFNDRLRFVTPDGVIDTVPGTRALRSPENDSAEVAGMFFSPSNTPNASAVGPAGELYVAADEAIRRIDPDGSVTEIGGGGELDYYEADNGGDGGPAAAALVYEPSDIDVGADGTLYVADSHNSRIRRIGPDGVISTLAGGGDADPQAAEGGPAIAALLGDVGSVAVDSRGYVYTTDELGPMLRRIAPDGTISSLAGLQPEGYAGDGGPVTEAQFSGNVAGVAVDAEDNLYVVDAGNAVVRKVTPDGTVTTVGPRIEAVDDIAIGPGGEIHVTSGAEVLKLVPADPLGGGSVPEPAADPWADEEPGSVHPVAGAAYDSANEAEESADPSPPFDSTLAPDADGPSGVAVDAAGTVFYADPSTSMVRRVDPDGTVTTVAGVGPPLLGDGYLADDGEPAVDAQLHGPSAVVVDSAGNLYIADSGNARIRKVDAAGVISTVAGIGPPTEEETAAPADGTPAVEAQLSHPVALAVDAADNLYVADFGSERIHRIDTAGVISTIAGAGELWANEADGAPALQANLDGPRALAVDAAGNVYFTESGRPSVRRIGVDGILTTIVGDSYRDAEEGGFAGDGGPAADAEVNVPTGLTVDAAGSLYIADTNNARIRKVTPDGLITTLAGTGVPRDEGDDGPAAAAALAEPTEVAVAADGTVYLTGAASDRIRAIDPAGTISTLAEVSGPNAPGRPSGADPVEAPDVQFGYLTDVAAAPDGSVYLTDFGFGTDINGHGWGMRGTGQQTSGLVQVHDGEVSVIDADVTGARLVATGPDGSVVASDGGVVWRVEPDGTTTPLGGGGPIEPSGNGMLASSAELVVSALAVGEDAVFVADSTTECVYRIGADAMLTSVLCDDGDTEAEDISQIAVGPDDELYVASGATERVHRIDGEGAAHLVAGSGETQDLDDPIDGPAAEIALDGLSGLAVDADGTVFVTDYTGVRRIDPDGELTTVVEDPELQSSGFPAAIDLDAHGNLYLLRPDVRQVEVVVRPAEFSAPFPWLLASGATVAAAGMAVGAMWLVRRKRPDHASTGETATGASA